MAILNLNGEKVFKAPFGVISTRVMRDKQLTIQAKALCAYLCSFTSVGYTWLPDIKIMCSELNISRNEFYKYRAELIEHGYIEIENEDNNE